MFNKKLYGNIVAKSSSFPELMTVTQSIMNDIVLQKKTNLNLSNCYFKNIDFSNLKLNHTDFSDCRFENCKFEDTNFENCNFKNSVLTNCRMPKTILSNASFEGAQIDNLIASDATVTKVSFEKTKISNSKFLRGTAMDNQFFMAEMNNVKFRDVSVVGNKCVDTIQVRLSGKNQEEVNVAKEAIYHSLQTDDESKRGLDNRIYKNIISWGFTPTKTMVEGMRSLNEQTEPFVGLKEVREILTDGLKNPEKYRESIMGTLKSIAFECKTQELEIELNKAVATKVIALEL